MLPIGEKLRGYSTADRTQLYGIRSHTRDRTHGKARGIMFACRIW
jgi:hypothetical protein